MTSRETKHNIKDKPGEARELEKNLILHNDDVHTFDFVIQALMEICDHDFVQASQCAIITHYKGKCDIRHGLFDNLKAMKEALDEKELTTTIE
jgi:ATP-dependent Clp protease adaptor protein ClpS